MRRLAISALDRFDRFMLNHFLPWFDGYGGPLLAGIGFLIMFGCFYLAFGGAS